MPDAKNRNKTLLLHARLPSSGKLSKKPRREDLLLVISNRSSKPASRRIQSSTRSTCWRTILHIEALPCETRAFVRIGCRRRRRNGKACGKRASSKSGAERICLVTTEFSQADTFTSSNDPQ